MKQQAWVCAVLAAGVTLAGCGGATDESSGTGGESGKLVVWDWKSGDDSAAAYVEQAKADFAEQHPAWPGGKRSPAMTRPTQHQ